MIFYSFHSLHHLTLKVFLCIFGLPQQREPKKQKTQQQTFFFQIFLLKKKKLNWTHKYNASFLFYLYFGLFCCTDTDHANPYPYRVVFVFAFVETKYLRWFTKKLIFSLLFLWEDVVFSVLYFFPMEWILSYSLNIWVFAFTKPSGFQ